MKPLVFLLAMAVGAFPCFAQVVDVPEQGQVQVQVQAEVQGELTITGPEVVSPGKPSQFTVSGLDPDELKSARVIFWPRVDVLCIPAQTWSGSTTILFVPGNAPEYLLQVIDGEGGYAETVVSTKPPTPEPSPEPGPNPTPGPTPNPVDGPRMVLIIHESKELTPSFAQALEEARAYAAQSNTTKQFRVFDQDSVGPDGKPPAWIQSYLDRLKTHGVKIPALLVAVLPDEDGKPTKALWLQECPADGAGIIEAIKKHGG